MEAVISMEGYGYIYKFGISLTEIVDAISVNLSSTEAYYIYHITTSWKSLDKEINLTKWIIPLIHKNGIPYKKFQDFIIDNVNPSYLENKKSLNNIHNLGNILQFKTTNYSATIKAIEMNPLNLKDIIQKFKNIKSIVLPRFLFKEHIHEINEILTDDRCNIIELNIMDSIVDIYDLQCLFKTISINRSLKKLEVNKLTLHNVSSKEMINLLIESIGKHICLEYLNVSDNCVQVSELIRSLPRNLTYLNISGNIIKTGDINFLVNNTKLKSLDMLNVYPHMILVNEEQLISESRSLLKFNQFNQEFDETARICFSCTGETSAKKETNRKNRKIMLERNRQARKAAITVAKLLIIIRKYRTTNLKSFGKIPKELVLMMAKDIMDSYVEDVWQQDLR